MPRSGWATWFVVGRIVVHAPDVLGVTGTYRSEYTGTHIPTAHPSCSQRGVYLYSFVVLGPEEATVVAMAADNWHRPLACHHQAVVHAPTEVSLSEKSPRDSTSKCTVCFVVWNCELRLFWTATLCPLTTIPSERMTTRNF